MTSQQAIIRFGENPRWSDLVIHAETAYWVEVAESPELDAAGQMRQVLTQIDETLRSIGADRTCLLQVLVYLADLAHLPQFNEAWDAWVPQGHAPIRACVQAGLVGNYRVELVATARVPARQPSSL